MGKFQVKYFDPTPLPHQDAGTTAKRAESGEFFFLKPNSVHILCNLGAHSEKLVPEILNKSAEQT